MQPRQHPPASDRVRLRRNAARGDHDPAVIAQVLRAGAIAHVGITTDAGPIVLPMAYGLAETTMYLHGASANALLRGAQGTEMCATVTLLDGLVFGRSAFHNSMNYRCVVVRGRGRPVTDPDEQATALRLISDHVVPNWDRARPMTDAERRRTQVLALSLAEASAKLRAGDPVDEPEDLDGPWWAGHVPILAAFGEPVPSADLRHPVPVPVPDPIAALTGRPVDRPAVT